MKNFFLFFLFSLFLLCREFGHNSISFLHCQGFFLKLFSSFLRQSGTLSFPTALSKLSQLLSSKLAPHCRQVTLIFPFPLGTRSFTPQDGHLKTLYCRFCSIFCSPVSPYAKSTGHSQKFLVFLLPASQVLGKRTNTAKSSCQKGKPNEADWPVPWLVQTESLSSRGLPAQKEQYSIDRFHFFQRTVGQTWFSSFLRLFASDLAVLLVSCLFERPATKTAYFILR